MLSKVYFIHALSPIHSGTGQGTGVVDLPIAREKATALPIVPGSSIKGVLRDLHGSKTDVEVVFGPKAGENASEHAGALCVGDARLLCLPVRSVHGTFAWVTSPLVLRRLERDFKVGASGIPALAGDQVAVAADRQTELVSNNKVYLEDLDLNVLQNSRSAAAACADNLAKALFPAHNGQPSEWVSAFVARFAVVHDDVFAFLYETATEMNARIRIDDERKTVASGALWYEESLPAESVLWGVAAADKPHKKGSSLGDKEQSVMDFAFPSDPLVQDMQLGGKATVGRGRIRLILSR